MPAEVELPASYTGRLPRELSGGQSRRVVIARAPADDPRLIVAGEPVSAPNLPVRARILARWSDCAATAVELGERYGFVVVSDNQYRDLRFAGEAVADLSLGSEAVVRVNTALARSAPGIQQQLRRGPPYRRAADRGGLRRGISGRTPNRRASRGPGTPVRTAA
ncbi:hypothetical protein ABZX23_04545 [Nocardia beijingensis]